MENMILTTDTFAWTDDLTHRLIQLRYEKANDFNATNDDSTIRSIWADIALHLGLDNQLGTLELRKKWNHTLHTYRDIERKMAHGTCSTNELVWPHFNQMQSVMNDPSMKVQALEAPESDILDTAWKTVINKEIKESKSSKKFSSLWNYFVPIDDRLASCKYCDHKLSYKGTTSNLKRHLVKKHAILQVEILPSQHIEDQQTLENSMAVNNISRDVQDLMKEVSMLEQRVIPEAPKHYQPDTSLNNPFQGGKFQGEIWQHFTPLDEMYAQCNVCRTRISYSSTITNLSRHWERKHVMGVEISEPCQPQMTVPNGISYTEVCGKESHVVFTEIASYFHQTNGISIQNIQPQQQQQQPPPPPQQPQEMGGLKSRRNKKVSGIWALFSKLDETYAQCHICKTKMVCKSKVTNLIKHARRKHPHECVQVGFPVTIPIQNEPIIENHQPPPCSMPLMQYTPVQVTQLEPLQSEPETVPEPVQHTKKERRKYSQIWNFFTLAENQMSAQCNYCARRLSCKRSINILIRHWTRKHSDVEKFRSLRNILGKNTEVSQNSEEFQNLPMNGSDLNPCQILPADSEPISTLENMNMLASVVQDEPLPVPRGGRKKGQGKNERLSQIWQFYTILDKTFAQCKVCRKKLSYKSGVPNLIKHRRRKHPRREKFKPIHKILENGSLDQAESEQDQTEVAQDETDDESGRRKRTSTVWNYFKSIDDKWAICLDCNEKLSYSWSITSLINHRRRKHDKNFMMKEKMNGDISQMSMSEKEYDGSTPGGLKGKRRSYIWKFFSKVDDIYAKCKLCRSMMAHRFRVSNLIKHCQRKHPKVHQNFVAYNEGKMEEVEEMELESPPPTPSATESDYSEDVYDCGMDDFHNNESSSDTEVDDDLGQESDRNYTSKVTKPKKRGRPRTKPLARASPPRTRSRKSQKETSPPRKRQKTSKQQKEDLNLRFVQAMEQCTKLLMSMQETLHKQGSILTQLATSMEDEPTQDGEISSD